MVLLLRLLVLVLVLVLVLLFLPLLLLVLLLQYLLHQLLSLDMTNVYLKALNALSSLPDPKIWIRILRYVFSKFPAKSHHFVALGRRV